MCGDSGGLLLASPRELARGDLRVQDRPLLPRLDLLCTLLLIIGTYLSVLRYVASEAVGLTSTYLLVSLLLLPLLLIIVEGHWAPSHLIRRWGLEIGNKTHIRLHLPHSSLDRLLVFQRYICILGCVRIEVRGLDGVLSLVPSYQLFVRLGYQANGRNSRGNR